MRRYSIWSLVLLLAVLIPALAACDEMAEQTPSGGNAQSQENAGVPTRTLGPIVSFTPRFTATAIPSATFTPSLTPEPTLTPVPPTATPTETPTPTPTVAGRIRSTENVNLREGPGSDYAIVVSVPPGTELGVLGIQTDERGREWYKVAYTDEDGETRNLWIFAALVETGFKDIVGLVTPIPEPGATPRPDPTQSPQRVQILAYCQQKGVRPPSPTTTDEVFIEWSWYVARAELMEQHLENANYEVRLDGRLLEDWEQYATDIARESGVWIVYWYYPVGRLSPGSHTVEFRLTWDARITDGYASFGPGTANEVDSGRCTFTVRES